MDTVKKLSDFIASQEIPLDRFYIQGVLENFISEENISGVFCESTHLTHNIYFFRTPHATVSQDSDKHTVIDFKGKRLVSLVNIDIQFSEFEMKKNFYTFKKEQVSIDDITIIY